jgi:PEP-CTERM motif
MCRYAKPCRLYLPFLICVGSQLFGDNIYSYTGNAYTEVYGTAGYTTSDYLRGWIATPVPLLPGGSYGFFGLTLAFSFTDGLVTLTQNNTTSQIISFEVDNTGKISDWGIFLSNSDLVFGSCGPSCIPTGASDFTYIFASGSGGNEVGNPGEWTAGRVPEPSSLMMLGVGILAWGLRTRRS